MAKPYNCKCGGIGRRAGLRIQFPKGSGGSTPFTCTKIFDRLTGKPDIKKEKVMIESCQSPSTHPGYVNITFQELRPSLYYAIVTVPQSCVTTMYKMASESQKKKSVASGFHKGNVPIEYIEQHFTSILHDHLKELLFNYFVIHFLYEQLQERKIPLAGEPRLVNIKLEHDKDARFIFELTVFPDIELNEWKYFLFKAPKRKKYKDLDRQVEMFCKEEKEAAKKRTDVGINIGDWICLDLALVDTNGDHYFEQYAIPLWLKIGDEDADHILHTAFTGKNIGDVFISDNKGLQDYFSTQLETAYPFKITINDAVPNHAFDFELLKKHFKIKTNKEMSKKLIEVFSYRNNLSQRRAMAEEALQLMLMKYKFDVPNHLVLRQEKVVLDAVQNNPDYYVYRMQKDFKQSVKRLAEKQAKEMILLDHIAFNDNVTASREDVKSYLNLSNRPRMKEFIYFDMPISKIGGREMPISEFMLKQVCLREKAINHIIYHLTRR